MSVKGRYLYFLSATRKTMKKQNNNPVFLVADTIDKGYYDIYNFEKGGLANCRDLGGLKTNDGRMVKSLRFIRSGKLCKLKKKDVKGLKDAKIKTIVDLRMENEKVNRQDTVIEGIKYINIPIVCATLPGITREKSMYRIMKDESELLKKQYATADDYMMGLYDLILFSPATQKQLKHCLDVIMNTKGCVLWHCSAGKDRAGIVSMLVLGMLDVTDYDIISDYLTSNKAQKFKKAMQRFALIVYTIFTFGYKFRNILFAMLDAKVEYITHILQGIKSKYGSIENYCVEALKISKESINEFKEKNLI